MSRILSPQLISKGTPSQHWEWPGLEVKASVQSKHAGLGVFATMKLPKRTSIPYLGRELDIKALQKIPMDQRTHIAFAKKDCYIDGDPKLSKTPTWNGIGDRGLWIAAMINEGSVSPKNCKLTVCKGRPCYVLLRDILSGEELLTSYGSVYGSRPYLTYAQLKKKQAETAKNKHMI